MFVYQTERLALVSGRQRKTCSFIINGKISVVLYLQCKHNGLKTTCRISRSKPQAMLHMIGAAIASLANA